MKPFLQTKLAAPVSREGLVAHPSLYALLEDNLSVKGIPTQTDAGVCPSGIW